MKIDKNSVYWRLFGDIWTFLKLHMESTTKDEKRLISDATALYKQFASLPQADFVKEILYAVCREIDRNGNPHR